MSDTPFATAILLAGGAGARMANAVEDKILSPINGLPAIRYSIEAFARSETVDSLVIVYRDDDQRSRIENAVSKGEFRSLIWTRGGRERQDSVWSGLQAVEPNSEIVLIHDGARPLIASATIDSVARAARSNRAACVARKMNDTIKQATASDEGYRLQTLDRSKIWAMETPQAFANSLIVEAYRTVIEQGKSITDDLAAIEDQDLPVSLLENASLNPKLTTPEDIAFVEFLLGKQRGSISIHR
ncbi:MAG: 2-C-methyl-D-erythritol 4-phosphate cytidylyltransferase [Opitutales bacterium TMED158]|nr:MAG: 2-C-methyl-D-erythritol 4-phosphate cytidylyltransferase [Opitutales bacterium TMED158]